MFIISIFAGFQKCVQQERIRKEKQFLRQRRKEEILWQTRPLQEALQRQKGRTQEGRKERSKWATCTLESYSLTDFFIPIRVERNTANTARKDSSRREATKVERRVDTEASARKATTATTRSTERREVTNLVMGPNMDIITKSLLLFPMLLSASNVRCC